MLTPDRPEIARTRFREERFGQLRGQVGPRDYPEVAGTSRVVDDSGRFGNSYWEISGSPAQRLDECQRRGPIGERDTCGLDRLEEPEIPGKDLLYPARSVRCVVEGDQGSIVSSGPSITTPPGPICPIPGPTWYLAMA